MAIAFVNANTSYTGSGSTADSDAFIATAGNAIVVWTGNSAAEGVSGVADTAGNTYAKIGGAWSYLSYSNECWLALNVTGHATNVVRVTFTSSVSDAFVGVQQYSGVATSSAHDTGYTPAQGEDTSTPYVTGSDSTAENNEIILGLIYNTSTETNFSNGTGTIRANELNVWVLLDRAAATAGAFTIDVAGDSSVSTHLCLAVALKQAAAAASIVPLLISQYRLRRQ
jgi:hypothetical protein